MTRPGLLLCGVLVLACGQELAAQGRPATVPDSGKMAALLTPYVQDQVTAGAVTLVAGPSRVLDLEAVGYRDLMAKVPMQVGDEFWIASMSKAMTAACMMMLVDEGKVKLDDPVEKYLPEFKGQMVLKVTPPVGAAAVAAAGSTPEARTIGGGPVGGAAAGKVAGGPAELEPARHPITIREIMSHTAGLKFSSKIEKPHLDMHTLAEAVASYAAEPLGSQPGTQYLYSNEGINTAGRIVEVVSGMPYETFLQQRLLTPLGMTDTTFWPNAEQLARLAKSYKPDPSATRLVEIPISQLTYPLSDRATRFPIPAGGLFSTAVDVGRFCQMLLNDGKVGSQRLLSAKAVRAMTTKETPAGVSNSYGFGLSAEAHSFGHGGAYKTEMKVDTEAGLVEVFLVQQGGPWRTKAGDAMFPAVRKQALTLASGEAR